jgi:hypothetical protein
VRPFISLLPGKTGPLDGSSCIERLALEICRSLAAPVNEPQPARSALLALINEPQELEAALSFAIAQQWVATDGGRYEITASGVIVATDRDPAR